MNSVLRYITIASLMVVMCGFSFVVNAKTLVTGARIGDKSSHVRFVLDVKDIGSYKVFSLENPNRIVIDLPDTGIGKAASTFRSLKGKYISKVRYGRPKKGTLRVVLDLKAPVKIKKKFVIEPSSASKNHRLVLDIVASGKATSLPKKARSKVVPPSMNENVDKVPAFVKKAKNSKLPVPASMKSDKSKKVMKKKPSPPTKKPIKITKNVVDDEEIVFEKVVRKTKKVKEPKKKVKKKKKRKKVAKKKRSSKPVIIIDPGHGGIDPGAISRTDVNEKVITFKHAVALKDALERTGRYKVVLTRKGDYFVSLRDRVRIAREAKGDVFISLHADSHPNPKTRGLSVYTLSEKASDKEAASLARKANKENVIEGVDLKKQSSDLQKVLIDMVQRDTKNNSAQLAEIMVGKLGKEARLLKNTHRFAGFVVLTGADVPSVLVELGYLSNRKEEKLLRTKKYRIGIVKSIVSSVDSYFAKNKF